MTEKKFYTGVTEKQADEALVNVWTVVADSDMGFAMITAFHKACKNKLVGALKRLAKDNVKAAYTPAGFIRKGWTDVELEEHGEPNKVSTPPTDEQPCETCGRDGTSKIPDPYEHDLHGDDTLHWLCESCAKESADEL